MAQEGLFSGVSLESISVDEDGRVIVTDPHVVERVRSAEGIFRRGTNEGCNTVRGCGQGQNVRCTVTSTK